jgi:hypothetical protein
MNESQLEKAMNMNDLKRLGGMNGVGKATTAHRAKTVDQITRAAAEDDTTRDVESRHPAPEALAGWLAA